MSLVGHLAVTLAGLDRPAVEVDPSLVPVILLHGLDGNAGDMARLARALSATGRRVLVPSLAPSDGSVRIERLAVQLDGVIREAGWSGMEVDLVGYSMGGIVCREYVRRLCEAGRDPFVRRLLTLSSPHQGTLMAWLRKGEGAVQMRLGSSYLEGLNGWWQGGGAVLGRLRFASLWVPSDLIVVPGWSGALEGEDCEWVAGLGHFCYIMEQRGIDLVIARLD